MFLRSLSKYVQIISTFSKASEYEFIETVPYKLNIKTTLLKLITVCSVIKKIAQFTLVDEKLSAVEWKRDNKWDFITMWSIYFNNSSYLEADGNDKTNLVTKKLIKGL